MIFLVWLLTSAALVVAGQNCKNKKPEKQSSSADRKYTSYEGLYKLIERETVQLEIVQEFVTKIMLSHESNDEIEKILDLYEEIIDQRAPLHRTIGIYGTEPDEDSKSHLKYYFNQLRLMKRFTQQWPKLQPVLQELDFVLIDSVNLTEYC